MATYDLTSSIPSASSIHTGDILNCPYSGTSKTIQLPAGEYKLECWGAQGGNGQNNTSYPGGKGGYSTGILTLMEITTLYLYAGGRGLGSTNNASITAGGFNGGGDSGYYRGSSGGGGTDIRIGQDSLYARVIVAGGGGGTVAANTKYTFTGGAGGGANGGTGAASSTSYQSTGGTQTSGGTGSTYTYAGNSGAFGIGGNYATTANSNNVGSGAGGGWYGGGAGGSNRSNTAAAGSGGSGYVYTSATASNYPSGCLLNNSYYLGSASTVDGATSFTDYDDATVTGHSDSGAIRITVNAAYTIVPIPTLGNKTYNGSSQSPTETNYNSTYMTKSGNTSATLPGTYTITYTLNETDYLWSDMTFGPKDITWQITSTWKEAQAWVYDT